MAIKLQIRRDTLTNWNANSSVVLLPGEIGYVTDTRNMKIGDGTTVWSSLKYQAPYYTGTNSGAANTLLALDATNNRVGIGTVSPAAGSTLDIAGQTRLRAGPTYVEPTDNAAVLNYDVSGGILTVDARSTAGTSNIVFRASTSGTGGERVRIRPSGNVLETNGIVTSNRTTAGTFVVSGDGAYTFGSDTKQYVYGKPGNDGNVAIYTTTSGGTTNDRLNVTSTAVQVKTALTTTSTATIGDTLTVSTGGLTVSAGTVTVPAGSIAGTALADNGVTVGKLAQLAAGNFLGNSTGSTANVAAVTAAQAQTMLGLPTRSLGAVSVVGSCQTTAQKNANLALGAWAQFRLTSDSETCGIASQTWLYFVLRNGSENRLGMAIVTGATTLAGIISSTGHASGGEFTFCVCRIA